MKFEKNHSCFFAPGIAKPLLKVKLPNTFNSQLLKIFLILIIPRNWFFIYNFENLDILYKKNRKKCLLIYLLL